MSDDPGVGPSIIPHLWYADEPAALRFLQETLAFTVHFTAPEPGGGLHAELRFGRGFVMVGPRHAPKHNFKTPRELDGINTGAVYLATAAVDELSERARATGAEIVSPPHDTSWGSRDVTIRDFEGYVWHAGTYNPDADDSDDVFDALRYERAPEAIAWLCEAFGLAEQRIVAGDDGHVEHALLRLGRSFLLASSTRESDPLKLRPPHRARGAHTHKIYCVVNDPDAHHRAALTAGAEILTPPTTMPWGARMYLARDPEGYIWCFADHGPRMAGGQANA